MRMQPSFPCCPSRSVVGVILVFLIVLQLAWGIFPALSATRPVVSLMHTGTNVQIQFTGTLLRADQVSGPFRVVPGATNPWVVPALNSHQYWRAVLQSVSTFAAGARHSLAVRFDGTLWAWGDNRYGQLGDGTFGGKEIPSQIQPGTTWKAVSAGLGHTVALRTDGSLWTWGYNEFGQLGNGTTVNANTPQPILPGVTWKAVVAGYRHTLALKTDGTLWAWGINDYGQLGSSNPDFGNLSVPEQFQTNFTFEAVTGGFFHSLALLSDGTIRAYGLASSLNLLDVHAVSLSYEHNAALRADGTLWTWGSNSAGQLGNGTFASTDQPQVIQPSQRWQAVAAGYFHTVAVREDGTLWAWGNNASGQLGIGVFAYPLLPNPRINTPQLVGTNNTWRAVAAGYIHALALQADGTLWAWGNSADGQLGNGAFSETRIPQSIQSTQKWRAISAGASHTVASRADGSVWMWGENSFGQLGNGTFADDPSYGVDAPQSGETGVEWRTVAAGALHTAALRADGRLYTWGYNWSGQLGNGTFTSTNTPQPIQTNKTWQSIATGWYHTAGIQADGTLWAWGSHGDAMTTNVPQPILSNFTWRSVAAGGAHTLAIRADGTLWAWGYNQHGQLGDGTFVSTDTPQLVQGGATWMAVAAGEYHSLGIQTDGTLWAWGNNYYGQLGVGILSNQSPPYGTNSPQQILADMKWLAVAAGESHTVALRMDGTLWSCGDNRYGQLGTPPGPYRARQVEPVNARWKAVAAGHRHTVAVLTDGTLWAWGSNRSGQLGQPVSSSPHPVLGGSIWSLP